MSGKYQFSKRSLDNMSHVHRDLRALCYKVLETDLFDFGITSGYRDSDEQNRYFDEGRSAKQFPDSMHNKKPSMAIDILLYVDGKPIWDRTNGFYMAIGVFRGVAATMGIDIRVGADWDGDFSTTDQKFHDLFHIELR